MQKKPIHYTCFNIVGLRPSLEPAQILKTRKQWSKNIVLSGVTPTAHNLVAQSKPAIQVSIIN
jgi:hypothetical protein